MLGNSHCPVLAMKTYLSKRNNQCQALWQNQKFTKRGNSVLQNMSGTARHRLENTVWRIFFLKYPKKQIWLISTPHIFLRATSVTILKASGLENFRAKSVTSHNRDSAVENYHKRPTLEQQVQSSAQRKSSDENPAKPTRGGIRILSAGWRSTSS